MFFNKLSPGGPFHKRYFSHQSLKLAWKFHPHLPVASELMETNWTIKRTLQISQDLSFKILVHHTLKTFFITKTKIYIKKTCLEQKHFFQFIIFKIINKINKCGHENISTILMKKMSCDIIINHFNLKSFPLYGKLPSQIKNCIIKRKNNKNLKNLIIPYYGENNKVQSPSTALKALTNMTELNTKCWNMSWHRISPFDSKTLSGFQASQTLTCTIRASTFWAYPQYFIYLMNAFQDPVKRTPQTNLSVSW